MSFERDNIDAIRAWCKVGPELRDPGPGTSGPCDPLQSLKVGPRTPLKFKSETPGSPSKFKNGTPGPPYKV